MQEELASALSKKLLEVGVEGEVSKLEPLTGGASKEIWKFEVSKDKQSTKMILRRGSGIEGPLAIKTADEARIQKEVITVRELANRMAEEKIPGKKSNQAE